MEFDDIYRDAGYHPGCPTIGAALAAAQARGASLDGLLRAIVAGYEVSCRIGVAVQPSHYRYWHHRQGWRDRQGLEAYRCRCCHAFRY